MFHETYVSLFCFDNYLANYLRRIWPFLPVNFDLTGCFSYFFQSQCQPEWGNPNTIPRWGLPRTRAYLGFYKYGCSIWSIWSPVWGRSTPLPLLSIYFLIFSPFCFFLSFLGFIYFLLLSIPSLSTRIVPLRFQARGRRRRPNLGLVCFFCV